MSRDDDDIARVMQNIVRGSAGIGALALANLRRDLQGVEQRLKAGAYAETDFVIRDPFDVQRRTREYLLYVDGWRVQSERLASLLSSSGVERAGSVLELCPGWAPKTLMALARLAFNGRILVVDQDPEALAALLGFSRALQPRLRVETVLADVLLDEVPSADLVIANHVLDDILLARWAGANGHRVTDLYEDTALLQSAWRGIAHEQPAIASSFLPELAASLDRCVNPAGRLLLTHYPSNVERSLEASDVSRLFAELVMGLHQTLIAAGWSDAPSFSSPPGFQAFLLVR